MNAPERKPSAFKELVAGLTATIGLLSGAIGFFKAATLNPGIAKWVLLGMFAVCVAYVCWYVRNASVTSRLEPASRQWQYPVGRKFALFVPFLLIVGGGTYVMYTAHNPPSAASTGLTVYVAELNGPDSTYGFNKQIESALRRAANDSLQLTIIRIAGSSDLDRDSLRSMVSRQGGNVLLSGWYRRTQQRAFVHLDFDFLAGVGVLDDAKLSAEINQPSDSIETFALQQTVANGIGHIVFIAAGLSAGEEKRYPAAVAFLTDALRTCSTGFVSAEPSTLFFYRGRAYEAQGMYAAAIFDFGEAIRRVPGSSIYRNARGVVFFENRNFSAALTDFRTALSLSPRVPLVLGNLGATHLLSGNVIAAIDDFEVFRGTTTGNSLSRYRIPALFNLGIAFAAQDSIDSALAVLDSAQKLSSSSPLLPQIHLARGNIFLRRGDLDQAIREYETVVDLPRSETVAISNLVIASVLHGDAVRSRKYIRSLSVRSPERARKLERVVRGADRTRLKQQIEDPLPAYFAMW